MNFIHTQDSICIQQKNKTIELASEYNLTNHHHLFELPMDAKKLLSQDSDLLDDKRATENRSIVGRLTYIARSTRPDIYFSTNQLPRFNKTPSTNHLQDAYKVINYLYKTKNYALKIKKNVQQLNFSLYTDSDFSNLNDRTY